MSTAPPSSCSIRASQCRIPRATYRLQFNRDFTFQDARRLAPYLQALGVSDAYASPYLKARPESAHGYDIVDHNALNPGIGGDGDYEAFVAALADHALGQLLDIVPNHMGIGSGDNVWWNDVLENGPASIYAPYFDIDWDPVDPELHGKVLLPILGDQYGIVLENGELRLQFQEGAFFVAYYQTVLPLAPRSYAMVLEGPCERLAERWPADDARLLELQSILTAISHLPTREETEPDRVSERNREKEVIKRRLAALTDEVPELRAEIDAELEHLNGRRGDPRSFDRLDQILELQPYRLSYWRVAAEQINYRRFFDINELAAIRMENPEVFRASHRLVMRLLAEGKLNGLRIDHPDGLWDPAQYFRRLQTAYAQIARRTSHLTGHTSRGEGRTAAGVGTGDWDPFWDAVDIDAPDTPTPHGGEELGPTPTAAPDLASRGVRLPLYVVVEKILAKDEALPDEWPVHGTTGYDFMNAVGGIFVDGANRKAFDDLYARFIGRRIDFHELVYESKRQIMRLSLASEINMLANQLNRLSERDRRSRDFTLNTLRDTVREVIACFPVYRTYITGRPVSDRDRAHIEMAVAWARRRNPAREATAFRFLREVLLLEHRFEARVGAPTSPASNPEASTWDVRPSGSDAELSTRDAVDDEHRQFVMKFQQTTGPVMAKAVEDTAFYIYNRLVALNEVGGEPEAFGVSVAAFHRMNVDRLRRWPHTMLSTSTHDTKRSEDVRSRIAVLSEMPREWSAAVGRWSRLNRPKKRSVHGQPAPSRNDEYLLYQVLLGAWPHTSPASKVRRPTSGAEAGRTATHELVQRIQDYMAKATKEAKVHTSWINPNEEYDAAVREFVAGILDERASAAFLEDFQKLQRKTAFFGAINSLSQTLLKLTVPGVPDIYQGTELWDLSLVDPDNRRPVDYRLRTRLLTALQREIDRATGQPKRARRRAPTDGSEAAPLRTLCRALLDTWPDGRVKLYVTARTLAYRREHEDLFRDGTYVPLEVRGARAEHACAFARQRGDEEVLVIVPRLLLRAVGAAQADGADRGSLWPEALARSAFSDTRVLLADTSAGARYRCLFSGAVTVPSAQSAANHPSLALADILADFPVALLSREPA